MLIQRSLSSSEGAFIRNSNDSSRFPSEKNNSQSGSLDAGGLLQLFGLGTYLGPFSLKLPCLGVSM